MPDEKIEVEWIATANQMLNVINKIDDRMMKQEQLMKKLGDTSSKSADKARMSFSEMGQAMAIPTAAALGLVAALVKVADAERQIIRGAADSVISLDTMARKMQIQAGLTDPERQQATRDIIAQSSGRGVSAETGFRTATQLASSGFVDPIKSGSLTKALEAMQASSFQGTPEEFVQGLSQVLAAYKMDKTADNLQAVTLALQGLFKVTDFQLSEGGDFAKNAAVFENAGLTLKQSFAGFTALREVMPAEASSTGLRNVVAISQSAASKKEQSDALKTIGIKPDEVDFIGENLIDVLQRLKKGLDSVDKVTSQLALNKLFGRENVAQATVLLGRIDRIKELEKLQEDRNQFDKDLEVAVGGMAAERNRIENEKIQRRIPIADKVNDLNNQLQRAEDRNAAAVENIAGVPGVGVAAAAAAGVDDAMNVVAPGVGEGLGNVLAATLGGWFAKSDQKQDEQIRLQKEANELAKRQLNNGNKPAQQGARPREAPLPGAIAP